MNPTASKLAKISVWFWIIKITATTLGETFSDYLSFDDADALNFGYALTALIVIGFFLATLFLQLRTKRHNPTLFWMVILSTSVAGTSISDFIDRTLKMGYPGGSALLASLLLVLFWLWRGQGGELHVASISSRRDETFYWFAILISNTLGTALGDFLAKPEAEHGLGWGFVGSAEVIGALMIIILLMYWFTRISRVMLFWFAFILTRPLGATLGDALTKPHSEGGLDLGKASSSLVLVAIMIIAILISNRNQDSETSAQ
jgi:uncharacterized membrane-anchored protein